MFGKKTKKKLGLGKFKRCIVSFCYNGYDVCYVGNDHIYCNFTKGDFVVMDIETHLTNEQVEKQIRDEIGKKHGGPFWITTIHFLD